MDEHEIAADQRAARQSVVEALAEVGLVEPGRVADAILARLSYLDPPLLVVRAEALDERDRLRAVVEALLRKIDAARPGTDVFLLRGSQEAYDVRAALDFGLLAERDRLRTVVDADDWAGVIMKIMLTIDGGRREWADPIGEQVVAAVAELEAERDRLRAVVDTSREFAEVAERPGPHDDPATQVEEYVATRRALIQAVSALDGSADIGRHVTKTGKVLTDADIEALAEEAEQGYDVSHLVSELAANESKPSDHVPDAEVGGEESVGMALRGSARPVQAAGGPPDAVRPEGVEREALEGQHAQDDTGPTP